MNRNYHRIEQAIHYLREHFREQPGLEDVASHLNLSPFHFQRIFTEWAGVSPKKFLQFLTVEYAKTLLKENQNLAEVSEHAGLSGTGRLHDHFVAIEAMTPGEYKDGGANLEIRYSYHQSPYGEVFIASTRRGICHLLFTDGELSAMERIRREYPNATLAESEESIHQEAADVIENGLGGEETIRLHLKGTPFQVAVWKALLRVPAGGAVTYAAVAESVEKPKAFRAVGSAVGRNPVALIIPCHRVIASTGVIGNYHWGSDRKAAMIGREAAIVGDAGNLRRFHSASE